MRRSGKLACSLSLIVAVAVTGTACSSAGKPNQSTTTDSASKPGQSKKLKITMMTTSYQGGGWAGNNQIIEQLDKKLNIDLQIQWVPNKNYNEKLNVLAASGNFPDVYRVQDTNQYLNWQKKGAFLDVKPYLNQYPNLTKCLSKEEFQAFNPKDKYFSVPYFDFATRDSLAIRKDWLDKLHLQMPQTLDQLYQVAKAFATQDPDGNGKADTVGLSLDMASAGGFDRAAFLLGGFGLANGWKEAGGKLIPIQTQTDELKSFVNFMGKAYAENVLDKDFPVNQTSDPLDKFEAGKVGISYINPNNLDSEILPTLKKVDPNAEVVQLLPPKGPTGLAATRTFAAGNSKVVINSKIDKEKQQRILQLLNYMLSDEGYDLIKNGIEGVDYKKTADGKFEKLPAFDKNRPYLLSQWFFRRDDPLTQVYKFVDPNYANELKTWFDNTAKYEWQDASNGLVSPTELKVGNELYKKWTNSIVKIIVGQAPVSDVDKAVAEWKAGGGDQIIKEMNEAYQNQK